MPCSNVGGRFFEPLPPKFYPHAFNFRATFLCISDFAQKIVLHHMVKKMTGGQGLAIRGSQNLSLTWFL